MIKLHEFVRHITPLIDRWCNYVTFVYHIVLDYFEEGFTSNNDIMFDYI